MGYNIRPEQIALAAQECGRFDIEEATIVAALGLAIDPTAIYARQAIERLSSQLLDLVTAREDARNAGKVGPVRQEKHIADACTGFLVAAMIEVCATASVAPPPALAAIVRVHFGTDNYAAAQMRADQGAYQRAMIFKIAYPEASQSKIARFARVARTLVSEWNKDGALDRAAASHAKRLERETGLEARIAAYLIVKSQD